MLDKSSRPPHGKVAFVLGGGGVLGATQVGMLRALLEAGIRPDVVLGTSVGAVNGAVIAADPSATGVAKLAGLWRSMTSTGVFSDTVLARATTLARSRTHLYSPAPFRRQLQRQLPPTFAELKVPFQCVATSIERAGAHWFSSGSLVDAVLASAAVPGLLPPVHIGDEHFLDGGLVHSIPVGRAVILGAAQIFVLHVGRIEQPLTPPRSLWEVCLVAFEVARRHRFVEEMAGLPSSVRVHVLPSGEESLPLISLRQRGGDKVASRIERGYQASMTYLSSVAGVDAPPTTARASG
jgi:NTE family protein